MNTDGSQSDPNLVPPTIANLDSGTSRSGNEDFSNLEPGSSIGRYQVIKKLGSGSFGDVYLTSDQRLKREVAIKISKRAEKGEAAGQVSLLAEARAVAAIDHPNIVRIFDVDQIGERVFIVMEFIQGCNLSEKITEAGLLDLELVADVIRQVCEALCSLHQRGVIHRDLKPSNVMLTASGKVKVTDFGLALTEESPLWNRKQRAGTERYMAPEQILGEAHRIDGRTDLWATGVMLYEMLTGKTPFRGDSRELLFQTILSNDPQPVRQRRPDLPLSLERLCNKCLSKCMSDRYQSAAELLVDLDSTHQELQKGSPFPNSHFSVEYERSDSVRISPSTRKGVSGQSGQPTVQSVGQASESMRVVPRGLRPFLAEDSGFFIRLLPGPKDVYGLPPSIQFWRKWVTCRERHANNSVGVLYGPSGSGKSSFVRAGLLPNLPENIHCEFFDFTVRSPIAALMESLTTRFPETKGCQDLTSALSAIRRSDPSRRVLLIFDQFEQYLIQGPISLDLEVVQALRQCDGMQLKCLILVRDEFWSEISDFMRVLESPLADNKNALPLPLFNRSHAKRVLEAFGRAYESLPEESVALTEPQEAFIDKAIDGMLEEDAVLCVRISMFAEFVRNHPWLPETLERMGGIDGVAVRFLHDNLISKNAPMSQRVLGSPCSEILRELLPEDERNLKSAAKDLSSLTHRDDLKLTPSVLRQATDCLENSLRLITQTTAESHGVETYHLAHDYLVAPIRTWLAEQDEQTKKGRARRLLLDYDRRYQRNPSSKNLPSSIEYFKIATQIPRSGQTPKQQVWLRKARNRSLLRIGGSTSVLALVLGLIGLSVLSANQTKRIQNQLINQQLVAFLNSDTSKLDAIWKTIVHDLPTAREQIPYLPEAVDTFSETNKSLLESLAMTKFDVEKAEKGLGLADKFQIEMWHDALIQDKKFELLSEHMLNRPESPAFAPFAWLSMLRNDWRPLILLDKEEITGGWIYQVLGYASDDPEGLEKCEWMQLFGLADKSNRDSLLPQFVTLAYGLSVGQNEPQADLLRKIESWTGDNDAGRAIAAQWAMEMASKSPWTLKPKADEKRNWVVDAPVHDLSVVMIRVEPDSVTIATENRSKIMTVGRDIWLALDQTNYQQMEPFFAQNAELRTLTVGPEAGYNPVTYLKPSTIGKYCNWLSAGKGLQPTYYFPEQNPAPDEMKSRWIELLPEVYWDPSANGYRIPTESELALAAVWGEPKEYDRLVRSRYKIVDQLLPRAIKEPLIPGWKSLPNPWGFKNASANAIEYVASEQSQKFCFFRNRVPMGIETYRDDAVRFTGFRLARGAIRDAPK